MYVYYECYVVYIMFAVCILHVLNVSLVSHTETFAVEVGQEPWYSAGGQASSQAGLRLCGVQTWVFHHEQQGFHQ